MAFIPVNDEAGLQPIGVVSTTQNHPLGKIITAYDSSLGFGEFIYLEVPKSTAITAGLLYNWTAPYLVALAPTTASGNSGYPVAVAVNAVTSNASSFQYTWFQVGGQCTVLKTAVTVSPSVALFLSATAGRVKVLASTLKTLIGVRSANAATVTSTTSSIAVYLNGRPSLGPGI